MHAILWWQKAPFLLVLHGYAVPRMKANRFLIMSNDRRRRRRALEGRFFAFDDKERRGLL